MYNVCVRVRVFVTALCTNYRFPIHLRERVNKTYLSASRFFGIAVPARFIYTYRRGTGYKYLFIVWIETIRENKTPLEHFFFLVTVIMCFNLYSSSFCYYYYFKKSSERYALHIQSLAILHSINNYVSFINKIQSVLIWWQNYNFVIKTFLCEKKRALQWYLFKWKYWVIKEISQQNDNSFILRTSSVLLYKTFILFYKTVARKNLNNNDYEYYCIYDVDEKKAQRYKTWMPNGIALWFSGNLHSVMHTNHSLNNTKHQPKKLLINILIVRV